MSELSALAGSEGYGACDDEGDWGTPQQAANRPVPRKRRSGSLKQVSVHLPCLPVTRLLHVRLLGSSMFLIDNLKPRQ